MGFWVPSLLSLGIPNAQRNRSCLPPTWTKEELGKRSGTLRFGWLACFSSSICNGLPSQAGPLSLGKLRLPYTATVIVALAAQQAGRPDLIRSPKRVLAHVWEG